MQDVVELGNSLSQYVQRVGWTSPWNRNSFGTLNTHESKSLSHQWLRAGELFGQNIICASPVTINFAIILHMHVIF